VSLVAILDADKEGFLRSETSLIQMIGRAARNVNGEVIMYADVVTNSMTRAISETNRRRGLQEAYNLEHGIEPKTIRKAVTDILAVLRGSGEGAPVPGGGKRRQRPGERARAEQFKDLPPEDLGRLIQLLEDEMNEASAELRFEEAARLRDEVKDLKRELRQAGGT
jgi:excinuclease ABC subunit B